MELRFKEPYRYRALLIDSELGREKMLVSLLADRGILVIARHGSLQETAHLKSLPEIDLVIIYCEQIVISLFRGLDTYQKKFTHPILLLSETDDAEGISNAIAAGVDVVMPIGVTADRLRSGVIGALAIHERHNVKLREIDKLRNTLENRKLIERAKGILMEQRAISEAVAFREIQSSSMKKNMPMPEVARSIIEAKELLG